MKSKSLILMIVSLGFGLVAAIGISQVMGRSGAVESQKISMGPVLVTTSVLELHTELNENNVKIENWPVQIIPENAATSFEQIQNTATMTRLSKGLPIMLSDVLPKNEIDELVIPKGYKVVAIPVAADDTFVGLLKPGDKVDMIGIFKIRRKNETRTTSKTFLKAITVFSVGSQMRSNGKREGGNAGSAIVGVLVNAKQAEQIVLVQKEAQLKLVLRGDDADEEEDDGFGSLADLGLGFDDGSKKEEDETKKEPEHRAPPQVRQFSPVSVQPESSFETRIWSGTEVETFRYRHPGALPESERKHSFGPPRAPKGAPDKSNLKDDDDFNQSAESDRGLTEDEYPGE